MVRQANVITLVWHLQFRVVVFLSQAKKETITELETVNLLFGRHKTQDGFR